MLMFEQSLMALTPYTGDGSFEDMSRRAASVVLVLAGFTSACGGSQCSQQPIGETPHDEGASHDATVESSASDQAMDTSAQPEAWEQGYGIVCTTQAHTVGGEDQCGPEPAFAFISDAISPLPCGPCGFSLNTEATAQAREEVRPDACCYSAFSPPPP